MKFAAINAELTPLCPRHLQPMNRVDIYVSADGQSAMVHTPAYKCAVEGCTVYYEAYDGYHERPEGAVKPVPPAHYCRDHKLAMYVTTHALKGSVKHYKCPHVGCSQLETVRQAAAAS